MERGLGRTCLLWIAFVIACVPWCGEWLLVCLGVVNGRTLNTNLLSGTIPPQLGKLNPTSACYLTTAQCLAAGADWCQGSTNTNLFECPLPQLSPACSANLSVTCSPPPSAPLPSHPPSAPPPSSADRAALVALYNATNGAGWTTRTGWMSGEPCTGATSSWHGVSCSSEGRVTQLYAARPPLGCAARVRWLHMLGLAAAWWLCWE